MLYGVIYCDVMITFVRFRSQRLFAKVYPSLNFIRLTPAEDQQINFANVLENIMNLVYNLYS